MKNDEIHFMILKNIGSVKTKSISQSGFNEDLFNMDWNTFTENVDLLVSKRYISIPLYNRKGNISMVSTNITKKGKVFMKKMEEKN